MNLNKQIGYNSSDLGKGKVLFSWHATSPLLAVVGAKGKVFIIINGNELEHQFSLPNVVDLKWDNFSDMLALITDRSATVYLYTHSTKKMESFDTSCKDLTLLQWSYKSSLLAIGTKKGTIVMFNRETRKRVPIVGTHTQAIVDGVWTKQQNSLVMVGADCLLSVSDAEGSVLSTTPLGGTPLSMISFPVSSTDEEWCIIVVNLSHSLQVYNMKSKKNFTAQFQESLGTITSFAILRGREFLLGFSRGVVALAVLQNARLNIAAQVSLLKGPVWDISVVKEGAMSYLIGDNKLQLLNIFDENIAVEKESALGLWTEPATAGSIRWSHDKQFVALASDSGNLSVYSVNVMSVCTMFGSLAFYFSSSNVVSIKDIRNSTVLGEISVDMNAKQIAAGMTSLAICTGNKISFYSYYIPHSRSSGLASPEAGSPMQHSMKKESQEVSSAFIRTVEYPEAVRKIKANSQFAAVLLGNRVHLHSIKEDGAQPLVLPPDADAKSLGFAISEQLLVYTANTKIFVMALSNMQVVAEYVCRTGLKRIFPSPTCFRIAYIDDNKDMFLLNPVSEVAIRVEGYKSDLRSVFWDFADPSVFVAHNNQHLATFVYSPHSRNGPICESVISNQAKGENLYTPLEGYNQPIGLFSGTVLYQSMTGQLNTLELQSHREINSRVPNTVAFYNNLSLNRLRWCTQNITTPQEADDLAVKALHMLDIELAIRIYRQLSQPSLVLFLEKIKHIQEKNLLIGYICMVIGLFNEAQNYFLRSSDPLQALQMRRDLMQWEQALFLAKEIAPEEVHNILLDHAKELENNCEYAKAYDMYKSSKLENTPSSDPESQYYIKEHNNKSLLGIARCAFHLGRMDECMSVLTEHFGGYDEVIRDLCEKKGFYEEAANMYNYIGQLDKAMLLYIKGKKIKLATDLLEYNLSPNVLVQYAQASEAEGMYEEAVKAFTEAKDWDNVVRLKIEKLDDLHGAYLIVQQTHSSYAAALVGKACEEKGEFKSAVEFWVRAKDFKKSFDLAVKHDCMSSYENALLSLVPHRDGVAPVQYQNDFACIADHYDKTGKPGTAALFYQLAGNLMMALKKYTEGGQPEDIAKAMDMVTKARSDALTNKLIDYLMGETDGEPKDPAYIFKLYLALGSYEKAAKISIIIATKEQGTGNYRLAHQTLLKACKIMQTKNVRVPSDLHRSLMLLHSYIIVKDLVNIMEDGPAACRMLLRIARNIQKFPKYASRIITTTVLECAKYGFHESAFQWACFLIKNERYRVEMPEKSRRKVEGLVRRHGKEGMTDPIEPATPCPFCDAPVPEYELACGTCKNTLPFCIITGKHILKNDFATMPCCSFPVIFSAFTKRLCKCKTCPMCDTVFTSTRVLRTFYADPDMYQ